MITNSNFFHSTRLSIALASVICIVGSGAVQAESEDKIRLNMPSQSLAETMVSLAAKSGVQIVLDQDVTESRKLGRLNGDFTLTDALDRLLDGTGLTYKFMADDILIIEEEEEDSGQGVEGSGKEVDEEIRVTGTRLKNQVSSGSSTFVITREEIRKQGLGSVEDIIRSLPQNFSDTNAAATLDNSLNPLESVGQTTINLRGLGSGSTLVLVNNRRWVQSITFGDGTVNLNGIPFSAIERVEVLLDGASAIYGADAQGGVINFILRDNFRGAETTTRYEFSVNNGDQYRIEQNIGVGWESGSALATMSYSATDPVNARKAGLETLDFTPQGGLDFRSTLATQPGNVFAAEFFPGFGFFEGEPLGSLPGGDDGTNGLAGLSVDNIVPFDSAKAIGSTANTDSLSARISIEQELFSGLNLFADILYTKNESNTRAGSFFISTSSFGNFGFVPTTNPYNDTDRDLLAGYRFESETAAGIIPGNSSFSDQKNVSYTAGFEAELPFGDWTADFSASYSMEDSFIAFSVLDADLLAQRLAGVDGDGNLLPIEQVINPFGDGSANGAAAFEGLVSTDGANTNAAEQDNYLLTTRGSLFKLPAGEMQLVLGAEYRSEILDFATDPFRSTRFSVLEPERITTSFFTEAGFPLVGENNSLPGIYQLDLVVAARHDEFSFEGPFNGLEQPFSTKKFTHTAPKIDLAWRPIPQLKVRASWGESFRPASLNSFFRMPSTNPFNFIGIVDPENPAAGVQFPNGFIVGNPDVKPEISNNFSYGFDWSPGGILDGLLLSVTHTDIDITDLISSAFTLVFEAPDLLFDFPGVVERDPVTGLISRVNYSSLNVSNRISDTVDATITYDFDTDLGSFQVGLNGTYVSAQQDTLAPGLEPTIRDGTTNGPERVKARGSVGWYRNNLAANVHINYSSSYNNEFFTPTGAAVQRVRHYVTYDLNGSYEMNDGGWRFNGGVRNVFNRTFPFFHGNQRPWDPRRVDTRGRIIYLEVTKAYDLF